jgi:hypothetical protein
MRHRCGQSIEDRQFSLPVGRASRTPSRSGPHGRSRDGHGAKVSLPDDAHEREARQMAGSVMAGKTPQQVVRSDGRARMQTSAISAVGLDGRGNSLDPPLRRFFERRFDADLSHVRVHDDAGTAKVADEIGARAFTIGDHIGFGRGQLDPKSGRGRLRLAHEIAHVLASPGEGAHQTIWREDVRFGSPVLDETLMQYTALWGAGRGRRLTSREIALARTVFGHSVDYSRIRFIPSESRGVDWRVVGNTIREPPDFTIDDAYMAQTFIHEVTHVWQYQHFGSTYISRSLFANLGGIFTEGDRGAAYRYSIERGRSFFEYTVEQQASIVEDYFAAVRVLADPESSPTRRDEARRNRDERQPLIDQLRAAVPRTELDLSRIRASHVVGGETPRALPESPPELRLAPVRPVFEISW